MLITRDLIEFKSCIAAKKQSLLCIDYGKKKSGVAISTPDKKISLPLCVIRSKKLTFQIHTIKKIIQSREVFGTVIGYPENFSFQNCKERLTPIQKDINFIAKCIFLESNPILIYDESFSSKDAEKSLRLVGYKKNQIKKIDDQVAASIILEEVINGI